VNTNPPRGTRSRESWNKPHSGRDAKARTRLAGLGSGSSRKFPQPAEILRISLSVKDLHPFQYDTEERLTGIWNGHCVIYGFELDPVGDLAVETGFDGLRRAYLRDAAGQVNAIEKPGGLVTRYVHDEAGRVIGISRVDGAEETYGYRPRWGA
jgi:YD repeat-containing protein